MSKRGNYRVPIKPDGSVLHYPEDTWARPDSTEHEPYSRIPCQWRDNEPFQARLTIDGTISGRSAKYFEWKDADGRTYPMFATDMVELLRHATVEPGGVVHAFWIVRKRGSNYGIAFEEAM